MGNRGRKASARALSVAAEAVVRDENTDVYLQPEKPRLSDLLKEIQRQCQRKGLRMPNFRTVKRRVDAIDARALSRYLEREISLGKIIHGDGRATLKVKTSAGSDFFLIGKSSLRFRDLI